MSDVTEPAHHSDSRLTDNVRQCQTRSDEAETGRPPITFFARVVPSEQSLKTLTRLHRGRRIRRSQYPGFRGGALSDFCSERVHGGLFSGPQPQSSTTVSHSGAPGSRVLRQFRILELRWGWWVVAGGK